MKMGSATEGGLSADAASALERQLRSGNFVVTAELSPPVSTDPAVFIERAQSLRGLATAVNVTDGASSKAHLSSLAAAYFLVLNRIEPILQMTCRDRNRLALQGDLLGAVALGIRNVLILRGDDPAAGDQPEAKPVFDLDTTTLIAMAHKMRTQHRLPPGTEIQGEVRLVLGAAEVPVDPPADWQPRGLLAKAEAGADFIQTQFCMDLKAVQNYAARLLDLGIAQKLPILIGISPIPSARSARWMREKLRGTLIPDAVIERLERATDPKLEGSRICIEFMQQLAETPGIAGAHVMAPQNHSAIAGVIAASGVVGKLRAGAAGVKFQFPRSRRVAPQAGK
jgi:methylenetetrahydrofolate reductase (NADPH)